ncbi:BQ5605_C014g07704 [Microbotryum silenes-dioicae]|uniref:BQ5605_C014g07704 protein n=1 Tax=Microbotryum silenes-dioicae TaxID=796604 RepID=A0A2X0LYA6_9BASI|nr:BQ5605_C014g07704 [Microbotryum silenes-dioicae]
MTGPHCPVAFSCLSGASSHPVGQIKPSLQSSLFTDCSLMMTTTQSNEQGREQSDEIPKELT